MLDWGEIQYVFNIPSLKKGDILLMNTYHERQRKLMGNCLYDHAAIYVGDAFLMEADGMGVVMNHVYSYAFKRQEDACVLRLKDGKQRILAAIAYHSHEDMGKEFGALEARKVPSLKDSDAEDKSNRAFCSRFVAQEYKKQGIELVKNPNYCEPDDFLSSDVLEHVPDSIVAKTEEMKNTVLNQQYARENSIDSTILPDAFQKFSNLYGEDIQTMMQLTIAASRHPEKDEEAVRLLKEKTQLFRPQEDRKKYRPWLDNDDDFFAHFPTVENTLWYIVSQMLHYDKTYIPIFSNNAINTIVSAELRKDLKLIQAIKDGFNAVYEDALYVRKRLAHLYVETAKRYPEDFEQFTEKAGIYEDYEFKLPVVDISNILIALMENGITLRNAE